MTTGPATSNNFWNYDEPDLLAEFADEVIGRASRRHGIGEAEGLALAALLVARLDPAAVPGAVREARRQCRAWVDLQTTQDEDE